MIVWWFWFNRMESILWIQCYRNPNSRSSKVASLKALGRFKFGKFWSTNRELLKFRISSWSTAEFHKIQTRAYWDFKVIISEFQKVLHTCLLRWRTGVKWIASKINWNFNRKDERWLSNLARFVCISNAVRSSDSLANRTWQSKEVQIRVVTV